MDEQETCHAHNPAFPSGCPTCKCNLACPPLQLLEKLRREMAVLDVTLRSFKEQLEARKAEVGQLTRKQHEAQHSKEVERGGPRSANSQAARDPSDPDDGP